MSDALVWQLIRNNNSFLHKRGGGPRCGNSSRVGAVQFSTEPGNLLGVNSFKYSGVANSKAVHIGKTNNDLSLDMKAYKKKMMPNKSVAKTPLKKNVKTSQRVIKSRLQSLATKSYYRADLTAAAASRYNALAKVVKVIFPFIYT